MSLVSNSVGERVRRHSRIDIGARLSELLGPRYEAYREAWNGAGPRQIPSFPVHLDLEWYDECNQRCVFCPRNEETHPDRLYPLNTRTRIDETQIDRLLGEIDGGRLDSINFGAYAEPLLNPRIADLVGRFHEAGVIDSRIISNGMLLHKHAEALLESGLVQLFISLDAARPETYEYQRGPGFERVKANLRDFMALRKKSGAVLPIVRVSFVMTERNEGELDDFLEEWTDVVDFIDVQARTDYRTSSLEAVRTRSFNCIDPFRRVSLISNGDILPCCAFWGRTLAIGNLANDSITAAWHGEEMKRVRENLLADRSPVCVSCQSQ
jgi:radical SAM protein with 4Fe4S-binding SPASM domain